MKDETQHYYDMAHQSDKERIDKLAEDIVNEHYQNKISKQIESEAEAFADSYDRRGCGTWQGMFRGYKAGYYRAQEEITRLKAELERERELRKNIIDDILKSWNDNPVGLTAEQYAKITRQELERLKAKN